MTETLERTVRFQANAAAALAAAEARYIRAVAALNVATFNLAMFTGRQITTSQQEA